MFRRALLSVLFAALGWGCSPSPELERVALGIAAKAACSAYYQQVPVGVRSFDDIVARDVLPIDRAVPFGAPLADARITLDAANGTVSVVRGNERAVARRVASGGCVLVVEAAAAQRAESNTAAAASVCASAANPPRAVDPRPWPVGDATKARNPASKRIAAVLARYAAEYPDARALLVVHNGQLLAERYAAGFDTRTRHLGWSMAKTMGAMLIAQRFYPREIDAPVARWMPAWRAPDPRAAIRLRDLLEMRGGTAWNESYASSDSDVLRMLGAEADMAGYAASKPLEAPPGSDFTYSSGTSNILQAVLRADVEAAGESYCGFARKQLFARIGAYSARFEQDASGTNVSSSYLYATAHDWARFGLLIANDGKWPVTGEQVLPLGWTKDASPQIGEGVVPYGWQIWGRRSGWLGRLMGGSDRVPADAMQMRGHWGQSVTIVPSAGLVVVHLAWDTSLLGTGRAESRLVGDVFEALRG